MIIKLFKAFFFSLLVSFGVQGQTELLRAKAIEFSYREQWDSAVSCYDRMDILFSSYYFDRGMCKHLNADFNASIIDFRRHTELHSNEADGWLMLAESALYVSDFKLAQKAGKKFDRMEPNNSLANLIIGCAFYYNDKKQKSIKYFERALLYDSTNPWAQVYYVALGLNKYPSIVQKKLTIPDCLIPGFSKRIDIDSNLILHPSNTYEVQVFRWHCDRLGTKENERDE